MTCRRCLQVTASCPGSPAAFAESSYCGELAAEYARRAEQAISQEAAATFRELERSWREAADADANSEQFRRLRRPPRSHHRNWRLRILWSQ
jgi:hypothetical protein